MSTSMPDERFAATPQPPFYAVIFTSTRTPGDDGYGAMAQRMVALAAQETGCREWYRHYELRVARVERAYAGPEATLHPVQWDSGA